MNSVPNEILIAGNGGFSKAVQYACNDLSINYKIITRQNWSILESTDKLIFNATPVELTSKNLIDGRPFSKDGKMIANFQAEEQFNHIQMKTKFLLDQCLKMLLILLLNLTRFK